MPVTEAARGPPGPLLSPPQAVPSSTARATGTNRPSCFMMPPSFGHDAVQYLAVSDHAELLPRHALLDRGVRLEIMGQLGQRIDLHAQRRHFRLLLRQLTPDGDPVRGAVFPTPH